MPRPALSHLERMTTPLGLYEHAIGAEPNVRHGFCLDDAARALVFTAREPGDDAHARRLAEGYLSFVLASLTPDGRMHNRRSPRGSWTDDPSTHDHWGRGLWSLGIASSVDDTDLSSRAREGAASAMKARSAWPRSMAYAALGAAALLRDDPRDVPAQRLLVDARAVLARPGAGGGWPWPEDRLTYANAVLPEAMLVTGHALDDDALTRAGLDLLRWLVELQQHDGHLSVVPSTGHGPGDVLPGYAQQPIEVAVLAEAARTALLLTGDADWERVIAQCRTWFEGANDAGEAMFDVSTSGGFDGLERSSINRNQGAESTLAYLSTHQVAVLPHLSTRA